MPLEKTDQLRNKVRSQVIIVLKENKILARRFMNDLIKVLADEDGFSILTKSAGSGIVPSHEVSDLGSVHPVV
jgi:hypothetical protein